MSEAEVGLIPGDDTPIELLGLDIIVMSDEEDDGTGEVIPAELL